MRERGVSTIVSYVLVLGIVSLLTAVLFVSLGGFVETEQRETTRTTMEVVAADVAGDLESADRLARSTDRGAAVELRAEHPDRIAGTAYVIEIESASGDDRYAITLRSHDPETAVTVVVTLRTELETGTAVDGGDIEIVFDPDEPDEGLVVRDA